MPWVAREVPEGSKRHRAVNEPLKPHPGAAPPFDCASCRQRIGKTRSHWLSLEAPQQVMCGRCVDRGDLYGSCTLAGSRAAAAATLGVWP